MPSKAPDEAPASTEKLSPQMMLERVHGQRSAHFGVRRTYELLNKHFPGHGAVRALCDFILQAHGVLTDLQSDVQ